MRSAVRGKTRERSRPAPIAGAIVVLAAVAMLMSACAGTVAQKQVAPTAPAAASGKPAATAASDVQTCLECGTKKMPAMVTGAATDQGGVQVVNISIQGGTYVPNRITVKAGAPVTVVFTGNAKGCLAKPTFKSLGKSGDVTGSGTATIDLGVLSAGAYNFTCAMGMNAGTIAAQ